MKREIERNILENVMLRLLKEACPPPKGPEANISMFDMFNELKAQGEKGWLGEFIKAIKNEGFLEDSQEKDLVDLLTVTFIGGHPPLIPGLEEILKGSGCKNLSTRGDTVFYNPEGDILQYLKLKIELEAPRLNNKFEFNPKNTMVKLILSKKGDPDSPWVKMLPMDDCTPGAIVKFINEHETAPPRISVPIRGSAFGLPGRMSERKISKINRKFSKK